MSLPSAPIHAAVKATVALKATLCFCYRSETNRDDSERLPIPGIEFLRYVMPIVMGDASHAEGNWHPQLQQLSTMCVHKNAEALLPKNARAGDISSQHSLAYNRKAPYRAQFHRVLNQILRIRYSCCSASYLATSRDMHEVVHGPCRSSEISAILAGLLVYPRALWNALGHRLGRGRV